MERREFVAALATLTAAPSFSVAAGQRPEVETVWAEVPPGATLWGHVYFLSDEPVELTVAAGKAVQRIRGTFRSKRVTEYSWRNSSGKNQSVGIRAIGLAGDRELVPGPVEYIKTDHVYVAFGQRATPERLTDRTGGYPSEAVFIGYVVFE
jgi:hypothetical protein